MFRNRILNIRSFSTVTPSKNAPSCSALVIGIHETIDGDSIWQNLTPFGETFISQMTDIVRKRVEFNLNVHDFKGKIGQTVTHDLDNDRVLIFTGLGKKGVRDHVRKASAHASHTASRLSLNTVEIESFGHAQEAAEGYYLAQYKFHFLKTFEKKEENKQVSLVEPESSSRTHKTDWKSGLIYAQAQNWARYLMDLPSNYKTPQTFAQIVSDSLKKFDKMEVHCHDKNFIETLGMNSFLAVAQGSSQPPVFLEIRYNGKKVMDEDEIDVILVGKGVTFDSGGISIKPSAGMGLMKGDMGGAAVSVSVMKAIAELELPISVACVIPLCENMPSGSATRPGDIIRAMNGKTIEIDNTDAEGRLILADALTYATRNYKPKRVIDVATLTGAIDIALGDAYSGAFSNCNELYEQLDKSSQMTGDLIWRMPLHEKYRKQIKSTVADLRNVGGRRAGSCTAAVFLENFLEDKNVPWCHLDIAGVMNNDSSSGYNVKGMTGRPTRTLIEFMKNISMLVN